MKTKITALVLIATTALTLAPKPAQAGDKGLALVGGFLGGLIVASAINDGRHADYPAHSTTVVAYNRRDAGYEDRGDSGYWKEVSVRYWVPGCWVVERSRYGYDRSYRHYVEGYYTYRTDRVWVAYDRHASRDRDDRRDYDRHGYGRGR